MNLAAAQSMSTDGMSADTLTALLGELAHDLDETRARVDQLVELRRTWFLACRQTDPPMTNSAIAAAAGVSKHVVDQTFHVLRAAGRA